MKDPTPENAVGYVLVGLPAQRSWQGFFITTDFDGLVEKNIEALRPAFEQGVAPEDSPPAIIHEMSDIPEKDQLFVGGLASAICEMYASNQRAVVAPKMAAASPREKLLIDAAVSKNAIRLATFAAILRRVLGTDHFLVLGYPQENGWRTTVERVDAKDIPDAREKLFGRLQLRMMLMGGFGQPSS